MTLTVGLEISQAGSDSLGNKVSAGVTDGNCSPVNTVNATNKQNSSDETEANNKVTKEMTNIMDDLCLNSLKERSSRSRSKSHSNKSRSSSSSSSSSSGSSSSQSSHSRSWSRSRSRVKWYQKKRSRRSSRSCSPGSSSSYSKSYSRSRSRSYSPRQRRRYSAAYRRYYRSPPRYRSRSRSCSYYRRYSRSRSPFRGRRHYGFVRRPYSPTYRSYRSQSKSRSRSRTPLRLSEKEKMKLLEIAKMNASKALGKEVELPECLRRSTELLKTSTENSTGRSEKSHSHSTFAFHSTKMEEKGGSNFQEKVPELKPKSPYLLWRPVESEAKSFSTKLSPKHARTSRAR